MRQDAASCTEFLVLFEMAERFRRAVGDHLPKLNVHNETLKAAAVRRQLQEVQGTAHVLALHLETRMTSMYAASQNLS